MEDKPQPRIISLGDGKSSYLPVLEGPPGSVTLRSGVVTVAPGGSVGMHSTEGFEELIIVLEGQGELLIAGLDPLAIKPGVAAYCPPETEHNVVNIGSGSLQYVFVVARATS